MSINYLFCGDPHGDLSYIANVADIASKEQAVIVCVGDWGFIWPNGSTVKKLSALLRAYDVTMRFIDGNHDWHSEIWRRAPSRFATEIEENVIYQPRGSNYVDPDGTKFVFMGGAPSIDKYMRKDGVSWWATEMITPGDMAVALGQGSCDVLVTHDAPQYPPGYGPKGDAAFIQYSTQSMNDIAKLKRELKPSLHVHGHWHTKYFNGTTVGLDCNWATHPEDSYMLWHREI